MSAFWTSLEPTGFIYKSDMEWEDRKKVKEDAEVLVWVTSRIGLPLANLEKTTRGIESRKKKTHQ